MPLAAAAVLNQASVSIPDVSVTDCASGCVAAATFLNIASRYVDTIFTFWARVDQENQLLYFAILAVKATLSPTLVLHVVSLITGGP